MRRILALLVLAAAAAGEPQGSIRVRVVTFQGEPVTAARLEVRRSVTDRFHPMWPGAGAPTIAAWWSVTPSGADDALVATATTDADGWALFEALPRGAFDVTAHLAGRAVRGAQVLSPPVRGASPPTILLDAGHTVSGRVVAEGGAAIAGVRVTATFPAAGIARWDGHERPLVAPTDDSGAFRLEGVPEGPVVLRASPPGTWFDRRHIVDVPRDEPLEIALPLHAVDAVVTDRRTGSPVPGVSVFFSTVGFHVSSTLAHATTDAKGRLRFVFPGRWLGPGEIEAPGYLRALRLISEENPPDLASHGGRPIEISAVPLAPVRGVVRGPIGPVASATVAATWLAGFETAAASARTGPDGTFDLFVPEGLVHVAASAAGPPEPDDDIDVLLATGHDGEHGLVQVPATGRADLRLAVDARPRAGRVTGRLVTAAGVPVAGRIKIAGRDRGEEADSDGSFEIVDVPAGRIRLLAAASLGRSASQLVQVKPGEETSGVDIVIGSEPAARIDGRVTGIDRHPRARARDLHSGRLHPVAADGTFAFPAKVVAGKVNVEVVAADGWTAYAEASVEEDAARLGDLVLAEPRVRVFSAITADGNPIPGATATLHLLEKTVSCGPFETPTDLRSWRVDKEGWLRVPIPRVGDWEIQVRAPGYSGRDVPVDFRGDVVLNPPAAIAGRVRFANGRPAAGVRVEAWLPWDSDAHYSDREATTDADGRFRIGDLAPIGHGLLVESGPQGASVARTRMDSVGAPNEAVDIIVEHAGTIEGSIVDARGRPVAGAEVRAEHGDEPALKAETGTDGAFRLPGAVAGKYDVVVCPDGFVRGKAAGVAAGTRGLVVHVALGLRIAGRVLDAEGRPREGWVVNANNGMSYGEHRARTDANGRFVIDELEGGSWDLKLGQWAHRDPEGGKGVAAGTENVTLVLR